jgi:acetyl-CoA carboxylase biotin carboxyl carrier protein
VRQTAVAEKKINEEVPEITPAPERAERRRGRARANTDVSINMDELRELIALIRENALAEFELERQGFRVRVRREEMNVVENAAISPIPSSTSRLETGAAMERAVPGNKGTALTAPVHPGAEAETAASEDQDLHIIPSPIVGTFYRSPSPTAEPFIRIGSTVEAETVVCIIEAMKLMNEIQAETSGEVVKIYVENGQPVEYGQPLFGIKR